MRCLPLFVTALCLQIGLQAADAPATTPPGVALTTPDVLAKSWVDALRRNDLAAGFSLFTAADQADLTRQWQRMVSRPNPELDAQLDAVLRPVIGPLRRVVRDAAASKQMLAAVKPYLEQLDVPALSKGITEIAGFLAMAADTKQPGATGLDYAGLRDWLKDLATWLPTAGLTDEAKAGKAIDHLLGALSASGFTSAADVRALPLDELLVRLGPALPSIKEALALYDVKVDAFLESFSCSLVDATPEQATITLGFQSLGKARTINLRLVNRNNSWQLAPGNDNPLVGLSQLVMMALLMNNLGPGAPAQPQPAAPVAPPDDGAL